MGANLTILHRANLSPEGPDRFQKGRLGAPSKNLDRSATVGMPSVQSARVRTGVFWPSCLSKPLCFGIKIEVFYVDRPKLSSAIERTARLDGLRN